MKSNFHLLLLTCIIAVNCNAQETPSHLLNIGDTAPPLRVHEWIKGGPVQRFEKSKLYVVEFWATWCKPCIAAMPHLSLLANEYKDKAVFLGIDIYEKKTTSQEKIKSFVNSMGKLMDYYVAAEDSSFMETDWLDAFGEKENGIPITFVVNGDGVVAWIGHPKDLAAVLPKIANNSWNINVALNKKHFDKHLQYMDDSVSEELMNYTGNIEKYDLGKPDSALLIINEIIRKEPKLRYTPRIAFYTFSSLLKTDQHKAFEYGKYVLITPTYNDPDCDVIINSIRTYSDILNLSSEIYQLGAEAYQVKIDQIPYPELNDMPRLYKEMAEWFFRANNKVKAMDAQQKAVEILKNKNEIEVAAFESTLQKYKNMQN